MTKTGFAVLGAVLMCAAVCRAEYPISCWTAYRFADDCDAERIVRDWRALGVNLPMSPSVDGATGKAAFRNLLDLCGKSGLRVIVQDRRIGTSGVRDFIRTGDEAAYRAACRAVKSDWGGHPAVAGFYVYDEPDAKESVRTFRAARIQAEEIPEKQPYLNLLPWFDWIAERIGATALAPYLDRCFAETGLKTLGYDCYTQQYKGDSGYDLYFNNLREWGEFGKRSGCRWNTTLVCTPHLGYEIRNKADYHWQISTAVAMGASGISWFYPDLHTGYHSSYHDAPINPLGERTMAFYMLGEANRLFQKQYGALFSSLTFESAHLLGCSYGGVGAFAGDRHVPGVMPKKASADDSPLLVSFFHDAKGVRHLVLVNLHREETRSFRVTFAEGVCPHVKGWDSWRPMKPSSDAGVANAVGEYGNTGSLWFHIAAGRMEVVRLDGSASDDK